MLDVYDGYMESSFKDTFSGLDEALSEIFKDANSKLKEFRVSIESAQEMGQIKRVFEEHIEIEFDSNLCKQIIDFDKAFVHKTQDHTNFFGSPLLGVHPAKWLDSDQAIFMDEIMELDEIGLKQDLHNLPCIDKTHKVSSNPINLTLIYLAHKLSEAFDKGKIKDRRLFETAYRSVFAILHYKFITSLCANYFKYPADMKIALVAYDVLTDKFDIKKTGSWKALIDTRTESLMSKHNIHYKTVKEFRNDEAIKYVVTDIQTRIRAVIKAYTKVFYRVKESDSRILSASSTMETEEGHIVKDVSREVSKAIRYANDTIKDFNSFYRLELLQILLRTNPSASPERVATILTYICNNAGKTEVKKFIEELMIYSYNLIKVKGHKTGHIDMILKSFRSMMVGSTVTDPRVLNLKKLADKMINKAYKYSNTAAISPDRTTVLMYVLLRVLAREAYK